VSSATTATNAKNHFWTVYNSLRHQVGKQSIHVSF
jgi:hypothetical protein